MATTKSEIREWLKVAKNIKATHLIVVCDTFDWEDYPINVLPGENVKEVINKYSHMSLQQVIEVYSLSMDIEKQLESINKVWNL
jgi:hypothetical protein